MANTNNVLTLNGKQYDAVTGSVLPSSGGPAKASRLVDDFVRQPAAPKLTVLHPQSRPAKPVHAAKPHLTHHKPQPAQTLMRSAVKRPQSVHKLVKVQLPQQASLVPRSSMIPQKRSSQSLDENRLARAQQIPKHTAIKRFQPVKASSPAHLMGQAHAPTFDTAPTPRAAHPTPAPRPEDGRPVRQPSQALFEKALANAKSHEQSYRHPRKAKASGRIVRRRWLNLTAVTLSVFLLAAFIAYENLPNLTMRVAAAKAGIHATMPAYRPTGFSVGKFSYSPGSVAVNFRSNSDQRSYKLTEQASEWDSQALKNNVIASNKQPYQTYQSGGRTVFLYGNSATWVDGGIWYTVAGDGSLSTKQLLDTVSSM